MALSSVLGQRGFLGFGVLHTGTRFLFVFFLKGFSAFNSYTVSQVFGPLLLYKLNAVSDLRGLSMLMLSRWHLLMERTGDGASLMALTREV